MLKVGKTCTGITILLSYRGPKRGIKSCGRSELSGLGDQLGVLLPLFLLDKEN